MWHNVSPEDSVTVKQGKEQMKQYRNVDHSWLCSKFHLPELAAFNIRGFLMPQPVFFFKPGNL
jgi:hypothetical protein